MKILKDNDQAEMARLLDEHVKYLISQTAILKICAGNCIMKDGNDAAYDFALFCSETKHATASITAACAHLFKFAKFNPSENKEKTSES